MCACARGHSSVRARVLVRVPVHARVFNPVMLSTRFCGRHLVGHLRLNGKIYDYVSLGGLSVG